jgi:8-oxo-dGTP diphosphatase
MKETTLCYIEKDEQYLMLHRTKKVHDPNKDKWLGVGGKLEKGETPEDCVLREVREETGLILKTYQYRGKIYFYSDIYDDELMYLYTATSFEGNLIDCNEGELAWIHKEEVLNLNLWEGDQVFLKKLLQEEEKTFELKLYYKGDQLINVEEL